MQILHRSNPVGYAAKSSTDQTTERGMRLPMDNARSSPARSATIPSREKTIFTSMCRPTREEWTRHHRPDQRKPSRGNCHLQLDSAQSTPRPSRQQRPTKRRTELQPTRRFYLTTPRPEPCIYSIGSPSVQKNIPETVSKTEGVLPVRVDDVPGQTPSHRVTSPRSLFQHLEE